ncbi:dolichol phosphate-mannose biosynthesis regulatory protein-like [Sycon ciliatum]|uniref:dolichol phosphate-mannose biosynthesis regulatory protein-like n=1 Tax=Sycon ciliatum TaxID=27933 RepID=UPI0031F7008E
MASGTDKVFGIGTIALSILIFAYYTLWVIVLPFMEPNHQIAQYFLPSVYAIIIPLVAGVALVAVLGLMIVKVLMAQRAKALKKKAS